VTGNVAAAGSSFIIHHSAFIIPEGSARFQSCILPLAKRGVKQMKDAVVCETRRAALRKCWWFPEPWRGGRLVILVLVAVLLAGRVPPGFTAEEEEPSLPRLPADLWSTIENRSAGTMIRVDWQAVRSFPPAAIFLETGDPTLMKGIPILQFFGHLVKEVPILDSDLPEEAWFEGGDLLKGDPQRVWVRTNASADDLRVRLLAAGWWEPAGHEGVYCAPLKKRDAEVLKKLQQEPESKRRMTPEAFARRFSRGYWRVGLGEDGWMAVVPPYRSLDRMAELRRPGKKEYGSTVQFPWTELVEPLDGQMAVAALENRDNDKAPEEPSDVENGEQGSIASIKRELARLDRAETWRLAGEIGDMAAHLSETDGGLVIDVTARLPGGRGPGQSTGTILQLAVGFAYLGLTMVSPPLGREIAQASIEEEGDHCQATVTLSLASLMDAAQSYVRQKRRVAVLQRRLRELERQKEKSR